MSPLRQIVVSAVLLGVATLGAAALSGEVRGLLGRLGLDASPLALASIEPDRPRQAGPGGPVTVVMARAETALAATELRTIGTGRALRSVTLYPQAAGVVTEIGFVPGERVEKGHVLAALDHEAEDIALARAELALQAASDALERQTRLAGRNATARVTLDAALRARDTALLDLREARLALERRLVRAPFAGVLGLAQLEVGDMARPDTPIAVIDDRSRLGIELVVPERFAAQIRLGQTVEAETVVWPGRRFTGTIVAIDNRIDPKSRTLELRAAIPNHDDLLRPGYSFSVTLRFPGRQHVGVPVMALQWSAEGAHVWAVREGRAVRVPVTLVERRGPLVLVDGALAPGERVVVEGLHRVRPGAELAEAAADPGRS